MTFLNPKSSSTSDPAMVKSEATTAVPSQNVSDSDLPTTIQDEKDTQPVVMEAQSRSSPEPSEPKHKIEESTAIEKAQALDEPEEDPEAEYPHGLKLVIITIALCLSVFLVALVSTFPTMYQLPC
jgi:hypothetical protein